MISYDLSKYEYHNIIIRTVWLELHVENVTKAYIVDPGWVCRRIMLLGTANGSVLARYFVTAERRINLLLAIYVAF